MPSEAAPEDDKTPALTGRCYCGAVRLRIDAPPLAVAFCHCIDCRRWTGAPLPAFVAFEAEAMPDLGPGFSLAEGVRRWVCGTCGSPLAARFDYLPGQVYVPLGVLDQAANLAPEIHCHDDARLPWLHITDDLPRVQGSGRTALTATRG